MAIAVVVTFFPAIHNGFVGWDDSNNFLQNDAYRGLGPVQLRWMWTTTLMGHYVPLSWMTLGLDYLLWGMNPTGYHATNVVLHAASAALVYFIAQRLLRSSNEALFADEHRLRYAAAAAGLLFAIHPLRVESVAWVTERRDVLSCALFLGSALAYLRSIDRQPIRRGPYWLSVTLFICSVLAKATTMTLPAALLIANVYPLGRLGGENHWWGEAARRVYRELIPFAVIAASAALVSIVALHPPTQLPIAAKIAVSSYSLVFYVWKTLVPVRLSPLYDMPQQVNPLEIRFLTTYAGIIAASAILWVARRRLPGLVATVAMFAVMTAPMLGIVQNGPQIAADRYTYYSGPAIAIAGAGWLFSIGRPLPLRSCCALAASVLVVLGALTQRQITVWRDSISLWTYVVALDSTSVFGHVGLGRAALDQGDMNGAIRHYQRAVQLRPNFDEGLNNLGNAFARTGRVEEAIQAYRRAIAISPGNAEAHNDLGSALAQQGSIADAIEEYRRALEIRPDYAAAHNNWGAALSRWGDPLSAIEHYERAVAIDSTYPDAYTNWGNALVRLGKPALAEPQYETAIHLRPRDPDVHRNLGVALAQLGRMTEAADQFRQALELRPDDDEVKMYLARALRAEESRRPPEQRRH